jgi:hypothetical protein
MSNENYRLLSLAIDRRGSRPSAEQFAEMVARGAIDRDGNVILRRPDEIPPVAESGSPTGDANPSSR